MGDVVRLNRAWAARIAPRWAQFASSLGFDGIHWDTLGKARNLADFLKGALPFLNQRGLKQNCNFVGGFGWSDSLLERRIITFPYWEVWRVPQTENLFFRKMKQWGEGVFVCYPGTSVLHSNEWQNHNEVGVFPFDLLIKRWKKARRHGAAYLAIGDGMRHIQTVYLPDTVGISQKDLRKLQNAVFAHRGIPA